MDRKRSQLLTPTRPNSKKFDILKKVFVFLLMMVIGYFVSKGVGLADIISNHKTNANRIDNEDYSFFSLDHFWESEPQQNEKGWSLW